MLHLHFERPANLIPKDVRPAKSVLNIKISRANGAFPDFYDTFFD